MHIEITRTDSDEDKAKEKSAHMNGIPLPFCITCFQNAAGDLILSDPVQCVHLLKTK